MITADTSQSPLYDELIKKIRQRGPISWSEFTKLALYHPLYGYYTQKRKRVGRSILADFYTNFSLGEVFFRLLLGSINSLVGGVLKNYTFLDVGAEPAAVYPSFFAEAFKKCASCTVKDSFTVDNPVILFSNELFDAQPFSRLIYKDKRWHERGITVKQESLADCLLPIPSTELMPYINRLPKEHIEGYCLDISPQADKLLDQLTKNMQGLLLIFDYGYSLDHLLFQSPHGTARAYYKHEVSRNLLSRIGHQDITHHVCWDFIKQVLMNNGFNNINLKTQESFFVHNASNTIESLIGNSSMQGGLKELLFPQHMGHKFQVIWASR